MNLAGSCLQKHACCVAIGVIAPGGSLQKLVNPHKLPIKMSTFSHKSNRTAFTSSNWTH